MPELKLQRLPTVAPSQGPSPQFALDTRAAGAGAAVGDAVQQAAAMANRYAVEMKQRADLAVVEDAETEFERHLNDTLHGSVDGQRPGFLQEQGHNALEKSSGVLEQLRKRQGEIAKGLAHDGQREAFLRRTNTRLVPAEARIQDHVGRQVVQVESQAFEGKRLESLRSIANAPGLAEVGNERQRMEPLVRLEAKRRGLDGWQTWPPKGDTPAAAFLNAWRADVAKTVLDRKIAEKDSTGAATFLDLRLVEGQSVRELLGSDADVYVAKIGHLNEQLDAFDAAAEAVEAARDKQTGRVDEQRARALAMQVPRAYRKEARANVEALINGEAESWKRKLSDTYNRASAAYYGGADGRGRGGLLAISAEDRALLRQNDLWHHFLERSRSDAEHRQGVPPSREQELYFSMIATQLVDESTRGKYLAMTGEQFDVEVLSHIAPRDRRALLGLFLQAKGQAVKPDETLPATVMHEIVQVGRRAGAFPSDGSPDKWGDRSAVHTQVVRDLLAFQAAEKAAGRKIDPERWSKAIKDRFLLVEVYGTNTIPIFGSNDVVPEATARAHPKYAGKVYGPHITDEDRELYGPQLTARGIPSDDKYVLWWKRAAEGVPDEQNPPPAQHPDEARFLADRLHAPAPPPPAPAPSAPPPPPPRVERPVAPAAPVAVQPSTPAVAATAPAAASMKPPQRKRTAEDEQVEEIVEELFDEDLYRALRSRGTRARDAKRAELEAAHPNLREQIRAALPEYREYRKQALRKSPGVPSFAEWFRSRM